MEGPLISVIIPVYNCIDCLERSVTSVLKQTYKNFELLIVDDGSTDGSDCLMEKLALSDRRIRIFHKENGGSSSARNLGLKKARGSYVSFVDADDAISENMLEELITLVQNTGARISQVSRDELNEDGSPRDLVCIPPSEPTSFEAKDFLRELLMHRGDASFCTKLTSMELFQNRQFPEGVLNEDFHLLVEMLSEVDAIAVSDKLLYHVYYRMGSNTRKKDRNDFSRVFIDIVDNADFVEKEIIPDFPELQTEAVRFALFQRLDYMLHIPVGMMTSDNEFYQRVKQYLRGHLVDTVKNPYLTMKNKIYLILLTIAPKLVRSLHQIKMKGIKVE